jgi:polar amino acid transport system substrate-binding protein
MPSYKGQVVSLLKATAVVGYIAVQDLTKMGDIVRSRTYEAFFPLIAVTVIYFLLAGLMIRVVELLMKNINPKNRKPEKILKGVVTHD